MKDILNRMLNHEELSREETKNIIVGITKIVSSQRSRLPLCLPVCRCEALP